MKNSRLLSVSMLIILSFTGTVAYRGTIPVASFYVKERLERTAFAVGLLTTSFYVLRALAALSSGYVAETAKRAKFLAGTSFFTQILVTYYLFTRPSYLGVILVRGSQGVLNGLAWTSAQILLAASVPESYRGRAFALYGISGSLGSFVGDLFYKALGSKCLYLSMIFFFFSAIIVIAVGNVVQKISGGRALLRAKKDMRKGKESSRVPLSFLLISIMAIAYMNVMGTGDIAYVYFKGVLGISKGSTALLRGASSFVGTILGFFLGWIADKGKASIVLISTYTVSIIGALLISMPKVAVAATGIALIAASSRIFVPIARKLASELPRGNLYLGVLGALGNVGAASGGAVFGYLYTLLDTSRFMIDGLSLIKAPLLTTFWAYIIPFLLIKDLRARKSS